MRIMWRYVEVKGGFGKLKTLGSSGPSMMTIKKFVCLYNSSYFRFSAFMLFQKMGTKSEWHATMIKVW